MDDAKPETNVYFERVVTECLVITIEDPDRESASDTAIDLLDKSPELFKDEWKRVSGEGNFSIISVETNQ